MKFTTIEDLYLSMIKNLHSCERQTLTVLPQLADTAGSMMLKRTLTKHLGESTEQLGRLEKILATLSEKGDVGSVKDCEITAGLVKECQATMTADADDEVRDVAIICVAQRIEHHEIATYGCLRALASLLGRTNDVGMLDTSLREEKEADRWLSILAIGVINNKAQPDLFPTGGRSRLNGVSPSRGTINRIPQEA
jgi:ferritin-like metal-binding protein YciE